MIDPIIFLGMLLRLGAALVALAIALGFLAYLDRSLGIKFGEKVFASIERNPIAMAIYFGFRFIGVCLLVGLAIG
jgi:hypothetical protein